MFYSINLDIRYNNYTIIEISWIESGRLKVMEESSKDTSSNLTRNNTTPKSGTLSKHMFCRY
jgi:hypothetical protein